MKLFLFLVEPKVNFTDTTFRCPKDSVLMSACLSTFLPKDSVVMTFQWKRNGVIIPGATGCTYLAKLSGQYKVDISVTLTYWSELVKKYLTKTCTETVKINVNPSTVTAPPEPVFATDSILCFDNYHKFVVQNPDINGKYTWIYNNDTLKTETSSIANIKMTALGGKVCVYFTNKCNLSSTVACMDIRVNLNPNKPVITGNPLVCNGIASDYCISNYSNTYLYQWTVPNGASFVPKGNNCITVNWGSLTGNQNVCVSANNECGKNDTCFTVELKNKPVPITSIYGNVNTCLLDTTKYWITPSTDAISYEWSINGGKILSSNTADSVLVVWNNVGNGSICINAQNICGKSVDFCQNIIIGEKPKLLPINGKTSICEKSTNTYTIASIKSNELIFWTVNNGTIINGQGTASIDVTWDKGLTNTQVCYTLTNECGPVKQCLDVNLIKLPNSNVGVDKKVCGLTTNLNALPDVGTGLWTFISGPSNNISYNNPILPNSTTTVDQCGTYQFKWTENNQGCVDSAFYKVTFVDFPKPIQIAEICNAAQTQYNVNFNVSGCGTSYSVKDLKTNIITPLNNSPFTFSSNLIAESTTYQFVITDNDGCKSDTITGIKKCNCPTKSGTMSTTLLEVCQNSTGTASHNVGTENLEIDDSFEYILHDIQGTQLGTIFARNQTGIFGYLPILQFEKTYYISYVAGNKIGNQVDLQDLCLSVAAGQPIVFHRIPKPNAGIDTAFCGLSGHLLATPDLGSGSWKLISGPGTVNFNNVNLPTTNIDVTVIGKYLFEWTDDNQSCIGKDTVAITFRDNQLFSKNLVYNCAADGQSYTFSFTISGGNAPYFVNGVKIVGSTFTSSAIGTSVNDTFDITDNFKCSNIKIPVFKVCDCKTKANSVTQINTVLCKNDTLAVQGNFVKDPTDDIEYVLSDKCDIFDPTITIFDRNKTGKFTLKPNMTCGTDYNVILLVGNPKPNGQIDSQDPCFDTKCTTVRFDCYPVVNAGANTDNCGLNGTLNGSINNGSITWKPVNNNNVLIADNSSLNSIINVPNCGKFQFEITGNYKGCLSKDTVEHTFNTPPVISNIGATCDNTNTNYVVTFDVSSCSTTFTVNGMNGGTINANSFTSKPISGLVANYKFVITDLLGCKDSISGEQICDCYTTSGSLPSNLLKTCITSAGIGNISTKSNNDYVLDANDTYEYILTDDINGSVLGTIISRNKTGSFNYVPTIVFGKTYYIVFAAGDSLTNGQVNLSASNKCLALTSQPIQFFECPELNCQNDTIVDCIFTAAIQSNGIVGKGVWSIVSSPANSTLAFGKNTDENTTIKVDKVGLYKLRRIQTNDIFADTCDINVTFRIASAPTIDPNTLVYNTICKDTAYTVSFKLNGFPPYQLLTGSDNATFNGNILTSVSFKSETPYKYIIKDKISCDSTIIEGVFKTNCKSNAGTKVKDLVLCQPTDTIIDMFDLIAGEEKIGSWSALPAVNGSPAKFETRFAAPGVYTFTYIIPDKNTSPTYQGDTSEVLITIHPAPISDAGADKSITCKDLNIQLGGKGTSLGSEIEYNWQGSVSNPNIYNPTTNTSGTFVLNVKNKITGCKSSDTVNIISKNVKPTGIVNISNILCPGDGNGTISFVISKGTKPYLFDYQQTKGNIATNDTLTFSALKAGEYKLKIIDQNFCTWDTTIQLIDPKPISVDLGADINILLGDGADINATLTNFSYPNEVDSLRWSINKVDTLIQGLSFKTFPNVTSQYCIYLKNKSGCVTEDCILVGVEKKYPVYIPNTFSPNSDTYNDRFSPYVDPRFVKTVEAFSVYDRWGNLLYSAKDFKPTDDQYGWDGTFNGKRMNSGVYVYHAKVIFLDGTAKVYKGDVTLLDRD
ncbi:MAG: gliding motility-associated C-terminal domain-containing protein [Saprospiraceae bacterium]|nr:gliding motility-associated C-terminal domain-containing protein [Saprospiraceae bacterium]